jgi:hypothetical protein
MSKKTQMTAYATRRFACCLIAALVRDFRFLLPRFQLFSTPARALAAETLTLERSPSAERGMWSAGFPEELDLMWKTASPGMPIPPPTSLNGSVLEGRRM